MAPNSHCYFDYYQDLIVKEPKAVGHLNSLYHVWHFDPLKGIPPQGVPHILGLQGNLWCEWVPTVSHAEYMLYPRAFALAEIGWHKQEEGGYPAFRERALALSDVFRRRGYNPFDLRTESERARTYSIDEL